MNEKYSLFVCGTVTNKSGFRFKVLTDTPLPGTPAKYLEIDAEKLNDGSTYIIRHKEIDGVNYAMIVEYREIATRDQQSIRGAYIAVGVLVSGSMTVNDSIVYNQMIAEVHAHLKAYRNADNQFVPSFELEKYMYRPKSINLDSAYLIDTLCKASFGDKPFDSRESIVYSDVKYTNQMISSHGFKYMADNTEALKRIEKLESELDEEKEKSAGHKHVWKELKSELVNVERLERELRSEKNKSVECNRLRQDADSKLEEQARRYSVIDEKVKNLENTVVFKEQELSMAKNKNHYKDKEIEEWKSRYNEEQKRRSSQQDKKYRDMPFGEIIGGSDGEQEKNSNAFVDFVKKNLRYIIVGLIFSLAVGVFINLDEIIVEEDGVDKKAILIPKKETVKNEEFYRIRGLSGEASSKDSTNESLYKVARTVVIDKSKELYTHPNFNSKYYNEHNAFQERSINASTWYVYGRVLELVSQNQLPIEAKEKMKQAFMGTRGRYAKDWATKLHLSNGKKILPIEEREKGLLAIWECKINNQKKGHVGFVEEISGDKRGYLLSDYDRTISTQRDGVYRDKWYTFPIDSLSQKELEGYLNGCLPTFYKLTP